MGQKTKIGKQRKDKYYRLAKETGFRSRAAFKLLQLNRKYGFLEKSRVLIDLCAAPGGWMQVAQQNMPVSSIVIGVDLYPIPSIPGCISLVEDITTDKCRSALTKALQSWKADVILNDGAPNVGKNWDIDAYQQSCLTLSALKLATEFLREGGWFITKIFRSKDYNSLLWVLKQLFKRVDATKPQASRLESAEIFVVCQHYRAPDEIDPKFMQPQYVFKELDTSMKNKFNLFHPDKQKKPKAEGYEDGDNTLFHTFKVTDFLKSKCPTEFLQKASNLVFDDERFLNHEKTTNEVKECFKDIRVLNRKDLRLLLKWRKAMKEYIKNKNKENADDQKVPEIKEDEVKKDDEETELDEIEKHIKEMKEEEARSLKKRRRTAEKERQKLQEKMQLKMIMEGDQGPVLEEENIFRLSQIRSTKELKKIADQNPETLVESEPESEEDEIPRKKKVRYDIEKTHLDSSGTFYKEDDSEPEQEVEDESSMDLEEGLGLSEEEMENASDEGTKAGDNKNPLLTDLDYRRRKEKRLSKVNMWFEKDVFKDLETEADEDYELDTLMKDLKRKGNKIIGEKEEIEDVKPKKIKMEKKEESDSDSDTDSDGSNYEVEKEMGKKKKKRKLRENEFEVVSKDTGGSKKKLSVEGLALGTLMISSQKKKRDLVDAAWNRYAFNDENLPEWFAEDEKKHMTQEIPVPEELVNEYKKNMTEINARPIKKVIEAKARKKRRILKKLKKAKKKVEKIMDNADETDREKARQIQKLYKKARGTKKEVTYVVSKKHLATKRVRRPPGIKGRFKVVDPRMKKDNRRAKNSRKEKNKSGKSKKRRN